MTNMKAINKLLDWYFSKKSLPYWCVFLLDCAIVLFSGVITFWALHGATYTINHFTPLISTLGIYTLLSVIGFKLLRTYSGIIRYSSFVDLQRVGTANILSLALALTLHFLFIGLPAEQFQHMPAKHIVVMFFIATLLMWGVRVMVKILHDIATNDERARRAIIYGAQEGAIGLAKNIRSQRPSRFIVKGFISHDNQFTHHLLMGEKVYNVDDQLAKVINEKKIKAVLISPTRNEDFRKDQKLQDILINAGVKIYKIDGAKEWTDKEENQSNSLREVSVEDLLPRDVIDVDMDAVAQQLKGKRVLITGSAGSIGSEMVRQIATCSPDAMMLIDQAETPQHDIRLMMAHDYSVESYTVVASICNQEHMESIFQKFKPNYVFHAAAYKHVPMMEDNPSEAVLNNVRGTKVIADLSVKYGVEKFVMVSTDKAVNPTNVMGCSKRICEIYVQSLNAALRENKQASTQFVTTRFGNVLGSNGSVIPLFREQIRNGGPVTVTHPDIIRFFMLIPEACKLVLEAGTKGNGGEIFVFDMGQPVRIADLADKMIRLSGAKGVEIKFTGLRAGEKLYEEVLSVEENTKPSFHKKIRIATVREYDYDAVSKDIDQLIEIAGLYQDMETVKKMKEIVPEYKSNNSIYSELDK